MPDIVVLCLVVESPYGHVHDPAAAKIACFVPDIPTFAELGLPALSLPSWNGLFAPKGTPKDIIGMLDAAVVETLADPAVRSRLVGLGMDIFPKGGEAVVDEEGIFDQSLLASFGNMTSRLMPRYAPTSRSGSPASRPRQLPPNAPA